MAKQWYLVPPEANEGGVAPVQQPDAPAGPINNNVNVVVSAAPVVNNNPVPAPTGIVRASSPALGSAPGLMVKDHDRDDSLGTDKYFVHDFLRDQKIPDPTGKIGLGVGRLAARFYSARWQGVPGKEQVDVDGINVMAIMYQKAYTPLLRRALSAYRNHQDTRVQKENVKAAADAKQKKVDAYFDNRR